MEGVAALAVAGAVGVYAIRRRAQGKRPHALEWVREPGFSVDRRAAFRVVTYNVLAPSARFGLSEKYDSYCPRRYREWSYRFPRILEQLDALDGDIVGIQETMTETFERDFQPAMSRRGYACFHAVRDVAAESGPSPSHTDALFVRKSAFEVLQVRVVRYPALFRAVAARNGWLHDPLADVGGSAAGGGSAGVHDLLRRMDARPDVALVAVLRHRRSGRALVACSTHLHHDPAHRDVKAVQAWLAAKAVEHAAEEHALPAPVARVVFGDLNSLPNVPRVSGAFPVYLPPVAVSGALAVLSRGMLPRTHPDHPAQRCGAALVPTLALATSQYTELYSAHADADADDSCAARLAHCTPHCTHRTGGFAGALDYILYSPEALVGRGAARVPWDDGRRMPPLPTATWPSDHAPRATELEFETRRDRERAADVAGMLSGAALLSGPQ